MTNDNLKTLHAFADVPDEELTWLLANSHEETLAEGDYFFEENGPADRFYIVLDGELQVSRTMDGREVVMGTTPPGIIGGELALLNSSPAAPISSRAIAPSRLLVFDQQRFREIFTHCPAFAAYIFRVAAERTQGYATYINRQERLAALGKLSAGLAHELNNPAAASRRAVKTLQETLPALQNTIIKLSACSLAKPELHRLIAFQTRVAEQLPTLTPLSPLDQADREDDIGEWLEGQGVNKAWEMAATFVSMGVTLDELIDLTETLPDEALGDILFWLCESLAVTSLLDEIEQSSSRISELVGAVKAYTYMDQAPVQAVDINKGLENTLTVMKHKVKHLEISRAYDPDLPPIQARGGELNQVWTNFIDNAVDALGGLNGQGKLQIITRRENDHVMVEITDNGPGIPTAVQPHLFEPFFTTKGVGQGTGLGLDICYRIINQHGGTIEVHSRPGQTRFITRLPVERPG